MKFLHKLKTNFLTIKPDSEGVFPELTNEQVNSIIDAYKLFEVGDRCKITAEIKRGVIAEIANSYNLITVELETEGITDVDIVNNLIARFIYKESTASEETHLWIGAWIHYVVILDVFETVCKSGVYNEQ